MDSIQPLHVDPQDRCFAVKSVIGGIDSEYPDAKNPGDVERIVTSTGARIRVGTNMGSLGFEEEKEDRGELEVPSMLSFDGSLNASDTKAEGDGDDVKGCMPLDGACLGGWSGNGNGSDGGVAVGGVGLPVKRERDDEMPIMLPVKEEAHAESCFGLGTGEKKRKEMDEGFVADVKVVVKREYEDSAYVSPRIKKEVELEVESGSSCFTGDKRWKDAGRDDGVINTKPINWVNPVVKLERVELKPRYISQKAHIRKKAGVEESNSKVTSHVGVKDGDFEVEPDWYLVGRSVVSGISTAKGNKLVDNEIVHFSFPTGNMSYRSNVNWIVRFSTKR